MSDEATQSLKLPPSLVGRVDLARLVREVETIDNDFETQKVRDHKEETTYSIPNTSRAMADFLQLNKIDIKNDQARMQLKETLRRMKDKLPIVHMTFISDPDTEFLLQLVTYVREELHPQALLSIGVQPGLIGGVAIRTPNHMYDFSIRTHLKGKRNLITSALEALQRAG